MSEQQSRRRSFGERWSRLSFWSKGGLALLSEWAVLREDELVAN
jgi:hypothetical protein